MRTSPLSRPLLTFGVLSVGCLMFCRTSQAHFPWLTVDQEGHAVMWFGESPADRTYPMPDAIAGMELVQTAIDGSTSKLSTAAVENDKWVGRRSQEAVPVGAVIRGSVVYGLYHGTKLTYHVQHLSGSDPSAWPTEPTGGEDAESMSAVVGGLDGGAVEVQVQKGGKPLANNPVKLYGVAGQEEAESMTDAAGKAIFAGNRIDPGLNAILVGLTRDDAGGRLSGAEYSSATDYLSVTFTKRLPGDVDESVDDPPAENFNMDDNATGPESGTEIRVLPSKLPELPRGLTSFGAAILNDVLYVYGGHTGTAHSYSVDEQTGDMYSIKLSATGGEDGSPAQWMSRSGGPPLQGLGLVATSSRLIRVGGFTAMNQQGQDADLQSQSAVAAYNPETDRWTELAPLPEGRSSLDAAAIGDTVYVFGGWRLSGSSDESHWHTTAWSLDTNDPSASWLPLPTPPFQRRAISVAAHEGNLYVIGGMTSTNQPTTRVDVYDPAKKTWSTTAKLPGSGMSGFGTASFDAGGELFVTTMDGEIQRLSADGQSWTSVGKTDRARFFHRMLPINADELLMIGGANMEIGKFTEMDVIQVR